MELQDKLVEDLDLALEESRHREDIEAHGEDTLPAPAIEAVVDASTELRSQLLGAIRMLLGHESLDLATLQLATREKGALEALQVAVEGRNSLGHFVYAEDRRDLLEQALAVLQPDLTHTDDQSARELQAQLDDLGERVGELRHTLTNLEDAQDEIIEGRPAQLGKAADEPSDEPKPGDPDAPRPATTLDGPERPEPARPPSTLDGPERPEPASPPSTLDGPERPEPATPPSTLDGPERPEPARPPSTLDGPERPEPASPPSTLDGPERPEPATPPSTLDGPERPEPARPPSMLADAERPAEAATTATDEANAKRSWWRRPFG